MSEDTSSSGTLRDASVMLVPTEGMSFRGHGVHLKSLAICGSTSRHGGRQFAVRKLDYERIHVQAA